MEIVVPPPALGVGILMGVPLLMVVLAFAMRGQPLVVRVLPVVIAAVVCGVLYRVAARPMRFAWDEQGIRDATFGPERVIPWPDVREARLVRSYRRSDVRPVRRTHGTYYSGFASGTWELADGRSVRVFLEPTSNDALLVTAGGETYLYSPRSFEKFLETARSRARVAVEP